MRVSALIVNYNTAVLTRDCVASLRAQQLCAPDGSATDLEIIVVDNASRPVERDLLRDVDATVIYSEDNRGYGAALNMATARATGEFLLFSNPDTWYFPKALQNMLSTFVSLSRCGAVGPRLWWDRAREFLLPPSDPVTLSTFVQEALAQSWQRWQHAWTSCWLRRAVAYWQCHKTSPQVMLSGACMLTHRDVLKTCGGFDEQFRLYYEDTDWCRRVRQHGYHLYYVPEAEVAHLYNQSARQESVVAQRKFIESAALYFRKHYGAWSWALVSRMATVMRTSGYSQLQGNAYQQLGVVSDPPYFSSDTIAPGPYLFLLSPLPSGTPAIGRFSSTPTLNFPLPAWQQLGEGAFYVRLISLATSQVIAQWSWEKREGAHKQTRRDATHGGA